ncbi:MAG: DnaJ domain-containing protein [Thiotrichaceae bacterium]|nr:DnaJ domain-containing protein [Thiotrichaceae bacterium]
MNESILPLVGNNLMQLSHCYTILNLEISASKDEIKSAYRRLARQYHPDVSKDSNAEAKFKKIKQAYEILNNNTIKQETHSQQSTRSNDNTSFTPSERQKEQYNADFFENITKPKSKTINFFDKIFGRHQKKNQKKDNIASISLSLQDIHQGTKRKIRLPNGRQIKVNIPKGIQEGQYIRLPKKSALTAILLKVKLQPHPLFKLKGKNLYLEVPIAPWEAALGSVITIPTLDKNVKLTLPEGTQSGTIMRLKGRGLTGKPSGDLYITLMISTPPAQTAHERNLYKKMKTEFAWNPRSRKL